MAGWPSGSHEAVIGSSKGFSEEHSRRRWDGMFTRGGLGCAGCTLRSPAQLRVVGSKWVVGLGGHHARFQTQGEDPGGFEGWNFLKFKDTQQVRPSTI